MSVADATMGFGLRDGTPVLLRELHLDLYGLRCGLTCAECGKRIEAVRRSQKNPRLGWKCLRHYKGDASDCPGYGENSCHLLAEHLMHQLIGQTIQLPAVGSRDAMPHVSRFSSSGRLRAGWYEPVDNDQEGCLLIGDRSSRPAVPDLIVTPAREVRLVDVQRERKSECGLIPDLTLLVEADGQQWTIAYEIRYAHAKTLDDVQRYLLLREGSGL